MYHSKFIMISIAQCANFGVWILDFALFLSFYYTRSKCRSRLHINREQFSIVSAGYLGTSEQSKAAAAAEREEKIESYDYKWLHKGSKDLIEQLHIRCS